MSNQFSTEFSPDQAAALEAKLLATRGFLRTERAYADWCFEGAEVNVAFYPKRRRLLVQGKGCEAFVREHLGAVSAAAPTAGAAPPAALPAAVDTRPHFGVDESGKGDYFGPLCIAGVYSSPATAPALHRLGCRDSKTLDDAQILRLADAIRGLPGIACELVCIGPKRYNELYTRFGNLNRLLAWGHARVIAALHEQVPDCPRALSDQFANEWVLKRALGERHLPVQLEQRTKGESDIAVAAASILARARFVQWMREAAAAAHCELPLGCSPRVTQAARVFVARHGAERLSDIAKLHFKTTAQVLR
ncbi:MAG: ribonuclease HIII [Akkermansia sp.]